MEMVLILVVVLFVIYRLGLFRPIVDLSNVATRESSVYNREHKVLVAKRYENISTDIDVQKVNEAIAKVDSLNFD